MSLGDKIRELRHKLDLTQGQLALRVQFTANPDSDRSYISALENGRIKQVGSAAIVKLAKALQVPEEELFIAAGLKPEKVSSKVVSEKTAEEEKAEILATIRSAQHLSREDKNMIERFISKFLDNPSP